MASNKNYIVTQIYNLSGDITGQRINLRKFDARKIELAEKLERMETAGVSQGQAEYEHKKKIKEVRKELDQNDTMLEKTESLLDNYEEKCQYLQQELEDAIDYALPLKVE